MGKPFIRGGHLVPGTLKGIDIKKLSRTDQEGAHLALQRAEDGKKLTMANIDALLKARAKGLK